MRLRVGEAEVEVNAPARAPLLAEIGRRLSAGEGFALATLNLDHLAKLRRDSAFAAAYRAQDLVTADGNPVVWLSHIAAAPVALIPGSDLVLPLARLAAERGATVALFGSSAESLAAAGAQLLDAVPGLQIAASIAPPMGFDPQGAAAGEMLARLQAAGARLVFVALGAPKQEIFAARGRREAPDLGFACIGAGLDFLAGSQRRAPAWLRRLALEWLWRLHGAPVRLTGRYLRSALVLPELIWDAWRQR